MHRSLRSAAGIGAKARLPGVAAASGGCDRASARSPFPHQVDPELKTRLQTEGDENSVGFKDCQGRSEPDAVLPLACVRAR